MGVSPSLSQPLPPPSRDPRLCGPGCPAGGQRALPLVQHGRLCCSLLVSSARQPGTSVSVPEIVEIAASVSSSFLSLVLGLNM